MKKTDYSPVGMYVTMKDHNRTVQNLAHRMSTLTECLDLEHPGSWQCHEELDSNLASLISQLEDETRRLKTLREYTLYPSVTQQQRSVPVLAGRPADDRMEELLDDLFLS